MACRWSPHLTRANSGKEQEPKETENRSGHHLVDGSRMDLLVQFGWQICIIHVVSVCKVFQQHVHQPCAKKRDKAISGNNPIRPADKLLCTEQNRSLRSVCLPCSHLICTVSPCETPATRQNSPKGTMIGQVML